MSAVDTDKKFHVSRENAVEEMFGSVFVHPLTDGRVELIVEEHTKKTLGKRWHSALICLTLDAEQVAKFRAALTA